jgi:hypothetical protein
MMYNYLLKVVTKLHASKLRSIIPFNNLENLDYL